MSPDRSKTINGHKIEEYYWAGRMVVYIDNQLSTMSFEKAVEHFDRAPALSPAKFGAEA